MSMPIKSFRQVLFGAAKRLGMVPEEDGLQRSEASMLTEFLNSAVKLAWEFYPWPDTMVINAEDVVQHPSIANARYVPRSTSTRILQTVTRVWSEDPRATRNAAEAFHTAQADGLYFYDSNVSKVWIQYRPAPPEFTEAEWSDVRAYGAGSLVWDAAEDATGHVFKALQAVSAGTVLTSAAHWQIIGIPVCIAEPVKAGVVGAWNASEGQHGTARVKQEYMAELLEHEIYQIQIQGGQNFYTTAA